MQAKRFSTVSTAATSGSQDLLIIKGDFEAIGEFMTDDVELNICGFRAIDGNWRGRDDVITAARKNYARLDSQQPAIEGIISQGDSVGVPMRESGVLQSNGQAYSIPFDSRAAHEQLRRAYNGQLR